MSDRIRCDRHGEAFYTFVCQHIAKGTAKKFLTDSPPSDDDRWPDAYCEDCDHHRNAEGEVSGPTVGVTVLCHHCYEARRAEAGDVRVLT